MFLRIVDVGVATILKGLLISKHRHSRMNEMKVSWQLTSLLLCGSTLIGCGGSNEPATTGTPDTGGAVAAAPAATETPAAAPAATPVADLDPILPGLLEEFEDLPAEFAEIKGAYETNSTDPAAIRDYVGTVEDLGMMHAQRSNTDSADAAFIRASETLTKALDAGIELDAGQLPAIVYYNHACVLGKNGKGTEALAILNRAVDGGFSNMDQITADADLASVRALPGYNDQVTTWNAHFEELKKQHEAELIAHAKEQLAKGESFAFDFDLVDVNGKPLKKSDFRGRVCVVDIWGTWCPPCRQEVPSFVKLQDKWKKYGFQMIGLNQERGPSEAANIKTVQEFSANNSVNYPCAMITEEVLGQLPELQGFPTTLFIDHKGNVRMKAVGYHEFAFMDAAVETLLREQAAEQRANTN